MSDEHEQSIKDAVISAFEVCLEAQLRSVRTLKRERISSKPRPRMSKSHPAMSYDILHRTPVTRSRRRFISTSSMACDFSRRPHYSPCTGKEHPPHVESPCGLPRSPWSKNRGKKPRKKTIAATRNRYGKTIFPIMRLRCSARSQSPG